MRSTPISIIVQLLFLSYIYDLPLAWKSFKAFLFTKDENINGLSAGLQKINIDTDKLFKSKKQYKII